MLLGPFLITLSYTLHFCTHCLDDKWCNQKETYNLYTGLNPFYNDTTESCNIYLREHLEFYNSIWIKSSSKVGRQDACFDYHGSYTYGEYKNDKVN